MTSEIFLRDSLLSLPLFVLAGMGLFLMLVEAWDNRSPWLPYMALISLGLSAYFAFPNMPEKQQTILVFNGMIRVYGLASLSHILICMGGMLTVLFLQDYFRRVGNVVGEAYPLILFAAAGMVMLANANDMLITFIGLETMSICLYIMAGLFKRDVRSNESGLKYFLLGAFATAFFIYGIAFIFGVTGTTRYDMMDLHALHQSPFFYVAFVLVMVGFLFKVSAFPFHMWTPDVYQGTPTPLAGFLSTAGKTSAFFAMMLFLIGISGSSIGEPKDERLNKILIAVAVVTMVFGNIVALRQKNLKRLLAYSTIAHAGYILLGFCSNSSNGYTAMIFYMFTYTLMNVGAFGIIGMIENNDNENTMSDMESWRGMGKANPLLASAMSVIMFSLAGIPPFAGFIAKYQIFYSALKAGIIIPSVIGILSSAVAAYYYIYVVVLMFFHSPSETKIQPSSNFAAWTGVIILIAGIFYFGVYPSPLLSYMENLFANAHLLGLR